ncbi:uncharacterized protein LOC125745814 [Brienomyrus brachyistius]|uniref:uncharacterized protein LOC125745814 n=1 Tax=Brienomyrus brachyistius TaxID=42636 RepID=UPI0020B3B7FA|nr:uncharacterized protein LOC125745814 [Brienomyrus brachyistius]
MGSEHKVVGNRSRCIFASMALVSIAVVVFVITAFSYKESRIWDDRWKFQHLNATTLPKLFQTQSNSYVFLAAAAINDTQTDLGRLKWEEQGLLQKNVRLVQTKTMISVNEPGIYLLFTQATFKLTERNSTDLELRVYLKYQEREDEISATFHKACETSTDRDAVLSHSVLLRIVQGNNISISANPSRLVDRDLNPVTSFLILLKVADL